MTLSAEGAHRTIAAVDGTQQAGLDDRYVVGQGHLFESTHSADASVVDPNINASEFANGVLGQQSDFLGFSDVGGHRQGVASQGFALPGKFFDEFLAPGGQDYARA